jgi:multiple sugar transport system permease protein
MTPRSTFNFPKLTRFLTTYGILAIATVAMGLPPLWLVLTSLKKDTEYLSYPVVILPAVPQWANYIRAFTEFPFLKYAGHSLYLSLVNTILTLITSAMAGFAFSRFNDVPGRGNLFKVIVAMLIIPETITVIPSFIVFARLKMVNTYWPWILWGLGGKALYIFMFRQFFASIPRELEEAAEVDGAGPFRVFWQIFLPNSMPVIATVFIFQFNGVWGDYITPLIYLTGDNTTLAVKLADYVTPHGQPLVTVTMAAAVMYSLPLIIMFFLGQRHILKGVVTTGIKG